jgi:AraC-like DNA-binding protein
MSELPHRLEGFSGQHLVVVPKPSLERARRHILLHGLMVTDAGYFPHATNHYVERANGASTHLVIACLRGSGWVKSKKGERSVRAGDLVWLNAAAAHAYGSDDADPWTIGWVHFSGDEAEGWKKYVGFNDDPVSILSHVSAEGIAALKLEQIYQELEKGYSVPELVSTAVMLRSALAIAAQAVRMGGSTRSAVERIGAVRDHLRENLARPHRLEALASAAGLSVPHFCTLFRRLTGYAPIDFLIRQRINAACVLLDTTSRPISTIASDVGYEDAYYFTRCFKRIVGTPPRAYRRIPKG